MCDNVLLSIVHPKTVSHDAHTKMGVNFMCFGGLIKDRYSNHIKMTMAVVPNAQLICPQNDQPHLPTK